MSRKLVISLFLFIMFGCSGRTVTVKTLSGGNADGQNFSVAADLSEIINRNTDKTRIKLTLEVSDSSLASVQSLLDGKLDFAIISAKDEFDIRRGYGRWANLSGRDQLRTLFSVHFDMLTFIASGVSGVYSLPAIRDKKINIGPDGSQLQLNARDIIAAYNMTLDDFEYTENTPDVCYRLFREGQLDGFFCLVSHPSQEIHELSMGRISLNIIPFSADSIGKLTAAYPYYQKTEVPVELYPNIEKRSQVPSLGIKNIVVSVKSVDDKAVYAITREVFENFEAFRAFDPRYLNISKENMLRNLSASLHRGAEKYYEETGLIKYCNKE
ncbi:MAG: TAXI family TRAP transporter solute-binding subunit [Spirochaetales bacterium]|nr:TAXI family TRAP transporter solute-binding subunit [Spirochaetales bacterium]